MKNQLYLFSILLLFLTGCQAINSEIDELYQEIEDLKGRQSRIEAALDEINSSLNSLHEIISALQSGVYIKSITDIDLGHIIYLSNGESLEIHDGVDGEDGYSPLISVKADELGVYYWTIDGDFYLNDSGERVRADGITPLFDIRDDYWFISYDNGQNWKQLDKAVGRDGKDGLPGDEIFREVQYVPGSSSAIFVLKDGSSISVPCYQAISISFNTADNVTGIASGETIKVDYSLSYGDESTVITAFSDGNYIVSVQKKDNVSGSIIITCPGVYMDGHINVMAFDGIGYAAIGVINFYEKQMTFGNEPTFNLPTEGGYIDLPILYNFEYYLDVDEASSQWMKILDTKAEVKSDTISVSVAKNNGAARTGYIHIYSSNTIGQPFATIIVNQDAAYFDVEHTSLVFTSAGDSSSTRILSSVGFSFRLSDGSDWVKVSQETVEADKEYKIFVTAEKNTSSVRRSAQILLYSAVESTLMGTINVVQLAKGGDNDMDLVFEVRAQEVHDYIVYLPIQADNWENDCTIDWGDNSSPELISPSRYGDTNGKTWHKYNEIQGSGKTFTVTVSGKVTRLYSEWIADSNRSGVIGVKQWGHTGLTNLYGAFNSYQSLEYISDDTTLAFSDVIDFSYAFANCPRLKQIPPMLFASASKAYNFDHVFYNCESITEVPERLFAKCTSAKSFFGSFERCYNLSTIPGNMFEGCGKVQDFTYAFCECQALLSIPEKLFSSCKEVVRFNSTFRRCVKVKTIPAKLFENNTKVAEFGECFGRMENLLAVPDKLFDNCPDVSSFGQTFRECYSLKSVPVGIFDAQRKVTNFQETFGWCYDYCGETPYTVLNGKKIHLYEREDYPDYFVTPSSHTRCFYATGDLTDKENIPQNWKEYDY